MIVHSRNISPRATWIAFLLLTSAGFVFLSYFNPEESFFFPPCLVQKVTSLHCPGCGATRACHALANGEVAMAFDKNPLFLLGLPLLGFFFVRSAWTGIVKNATYSMPPPSARYLLPLAVTVIAFGIVRNLPHPAFNWMAP